MLLTLVSGQTLKRSPRIYRTPKCSFFGCRRTTISNLDYFRPLLKGHPVRISVDPDDEEEIEKKLVPNNCKKTLHYIPEHNRAAFHRLASPLIGYRWDRNTSQDHHLPLLQPGSHWQTKWCNWKIILLIIWRTKKWNKKLFAWFHIPGLPKVQ